MPDSAGAPLGTAALWLTGLERGVMLAGLALALGGLAGRGLARQYKGARPGPLPTPWAVRGSLLGLAACAALLVTALAGPGLAAELARPPAPGLRSGGTAEIAAVELVLFAFAAVAARLRQTGLAAALLSGVIIAEGIRAHPEGVVPIGGAADRHSVAARPGCGAGHHPAVFQRCGVALCPRARDWGRERAGARAGWVAAHHHLRAVPHRQGRGRGSRRRPGSRGPQVAATRVPARGGPCPGDKAGAYGACRGTRYHRDPDGADPAC
jgi:hypothetical protein